MFNKITVIGGGNMGGALVKGWAKSGMASSLTVTAHTQQTLDRLVEVCPGITTMLDNSKAVKEADVVLLAVKPWLVEQVIAEIMPEPTGLARNVSQCVYDFGIPLYVKTTVSKIIGKKKLGENE